MPKTLQPLAILDTETTGTNPATDRIVAISILKLLPDGKEVWFDSFVNPGRPIPAEASAIHGITDDKVAQAPAFKAIWRPVWDLLIDSDLLGYCLKGFDLPLIWEEFYRCGVEFPLCGRNVFDAGAIFKKKEERTLAAAMRFYCDEEHAGAHGARADVLATFKVFKAQMARYPDLMAMEGAALSQFCCFDNCADLAGKLVYDDAGDLAFNIGEHKGKKVRDHLDFADWMLRKDFPTETKLHLHKLLSLGK